MLVRIQRNQIHHFKEAVLDVEGNPTGEEKDVLQIDVQFPEYPDLPTYGLRIDFPITKAKALDTIKAKAQQAKAQYESDEAIRSHIDNVIEPSNPSGFYEFDVEV